MKTKILCLLFAVTLMFSFCSCGTADCSEKVIDAFTAPFEYRIATGDYEFTYSKSPDKVVITVVKPETLEGLTLEKTESGITASYDGLVVTLPAAASSKMFALNDLAEAALKAAEAKSYTCSTEGGVTEFAFEDGDYVYSLFIDDESGKPVSAKVTEDGRETEYTFIK